MSGASSSTNSRIVGIQEDTIIIETTPISPSRSPLLKLLLLSHHTKWEPKDIEWEMVGKRRVTLGEAEDAQQDEAITPFIEAKDSEIDEATTSSIAKQGEVKATNLPIITPVEEALVSSPIITFAATSPPPSFNVDPTPKIQISIHVTLILKLRSSLVPSTKAPINETPAIELRFNISEWGRREQNGAVEVAVGRRRQGEQNGAVEVAVGRRRQGEQNGADGKDSGGCVGALGIDKVGNGGIESRR
ncbi:hypothetical protein ACFE04_011776 [Oxalis oulophora]